MQQQRPDKARIVPLSFTQLSLAVKKLKQVGKITWILLGIEAAFVVPVCALYVLW